MPFPIIVDGIGNEVRRLYHALTNPVFIINRNGVVVQVIVDLGAGLGAGAIELVACEKAKDKSEMVRMCDSEKLVGLTQHQNQCSSSQACRPGSGEGLSGALGKRGREGLIVFRINAGNHGCAQRAINTTTRLIDPGNLPPS